MQRILNNLKMRYLLAIIATSAVMIWQAGDAARAGSEIQSLALFWTAAVTTGWLQMILIARGVRTTFGADKYPGWALLLISALIGAVPLTFQIRWLVETIIAPQTGLPAPWVTYLNVCVINVVFSLLQFTLIERWPLTQSNASDHPQNAPTDTRAPTASIPMIGLLRSRPDNLNGVIQYMQMEDHYLRVQTNEGSGLTLHRMRDAVDDLKHTDGMQVHKSWWVSRGCIAKILNKNRKKTIVTKDGTQIPVGRSFESSLRTADWF